MLFDAFSDELSYGNKSNDQCAMILCHYSYIIMISDTEAV